VGKRFGASIHLFVGTDQEVQKQLNDLDVLIAGSFPERQTKEYSKKAKLFFRYSERPLKDGNPVLKYIPRFLKWHYYNPPWRKAYMLCASAYTAGDYAKFGLFHDRCYKWGYFPETIRYPSIDDLIDRKAKATILWCGRFLDWKHPDDVIEVAKRLRNAGCCFKIEMIGTGEMEQQLKQQASEAGLLETNIRFLGSHVSGSRAPSYGERRHLLIHQRPPRGLGRCVKRGHEQRLCGRCQRRSWGNTLPCK
jgi:hypothetical protein